jgi:hypothetical protein
LFGTQSTASVRTLRRTGFDSLGGLNPAGDPARRIDGTRPNTHYFPS